MITAEQLDAVLPRVPAGINSGDLTDPEERRAFVATLLGYYLRAERQSRAWEELHAPDRAIPAPESRATVQDTQEHPEIATGAHSGCFRCRGVLLDRPCSNCGWFPRPLPPPKPGTHESDLTARRKVRKVAPVDDPRDPGESHWDQYLTARHWSRVNATPDTPTED